MALEQNVRQIGDVAILDLSGRLSLGEALAFGPGSGVVLGQAIRELTKKGQKKILLNLAGVTYVDSSGVGQLMGAFMSARNQGGDLKLLTVRGGSRFFRMAESIAKIPAIPLGSES